VRVPGSWRRLLAAGAMVASVLTATAPRAAANHLVPFTQPLQLPPVYTSPNIDVTMREACVEILPGPCTKMWTYDGVFPGPTIRRPSGRPTHVTFHNELPANVGSTTVHHHGNHSESRFDGQPHEHLIPTGGEFTYEYDFMERGEPERAAFQWYHDHRMDVTGRNVWMGLAGMFVLDDDFDSSLPLPRGKYDVPLMVVDRSFDANNQLDYKYSSAGIVGDHLLVNGAPTPYFEVADRAYRFRLLNASNFREYRFELANGQEMVQVASESGLLPRPVRRTSILLGPAERAEVVVDFRGHLGEDIVLANTIPPGITPGKTEPETPLARVMQFRVRHHVVDRSAVPDELRPVPDFGAPSPVKRVFALGVVQGAGALHHPEDAAPQHFLWTINGKAFDPESVDASPTLGSTERWVFVNASVGQHRVHLHDVDWKIVSRKGGVQLLTPGDPDAALGEAGLRETFLVQSGLTVEV
jgi:spore coat protein A, manganese oxidase